MAAMIALSRASSRYLRARSVCAHSRVAVDVRAVDEREDSTARDRL